ncbi:protein hook homolog [Plakobranchus ocellatus]|uniref:Protein hook homolog n=1 Tax=Plakobranchus ocellatus TaxID=259542 RepID=A0AAV3ZIY4_9GAST|nr:protein hook homolog [Plakobranchus ocellatus]
MDEREQICHSLITWLHSFSLAAPHETPADLCDGVAIAQALAVIAPSYFTPSWLATIKSEDLNNWRLKVTNLKKILKGILEYNLEVLGITMQGFQMPDVNAIGEHCDPQELGRLLQLVLNVAINCDNKGEHIQTIMSMEEDVQQIIKNAIQELMAKESSPSEDIDAELQEQLKRVSDDLNMALEAKEELLQRCHELDAQVASLQEERQSLELDRNKLEERLAMAESVEDPSTPAGKKLRQLQSLVDTLQEEIYKLESAYYCVSILARIELSYIYPFAVFQNSELNKLASESRAMKDELDILRHTSEQLAKSESTIELYKKKLEDLSDLRGQMKMLEEKNTKYMQQQIEMEEELKRAASLKQQLESYKKQAVELQNKAAEETKRADKAEFEYKRMQEKVTTLQREKERVLKERDSLRDMNDEMKCSQFQNKGFGAEADVEQPMQNLEMFSLPPEIKERLMRLEHENKMLKMESGAGNDHNASVSSDLLDAAKARQNELETEVRLLTQQLMEVQAQLEDLQETEQSATAAKSHETVQTRQQLQEARQRLEERDRQLDHRQQQADELTQRLTEQSEKNGELSELLARKDEEIRVMEERYRKYLEKAKNVIKSLDPRHNSESTSEIYSLKSQMHEKDSYISFLEKDQEKLKSLRDQEEKLIVTAWYNLGMQLHRQAAEERLANSSMGQSFLARQRAVHTRRANTMNTLHNSNSPSLEEEGPLSVRPNTTKRRFTFRKNKPSAQSSASAETKSTSMPPGYTHPVISQSAEDSSFPGIRDNHFSDGNLT